MLVKSGAALERLAEVDHVIFDKTGVLTEGRPRLIDAVAAAVAMAAPLARASRHPLARALAPRPATVRIAADDVVERRGGGLEGVIDGRRARLGRATFLGVEARSGAETELWFGFDGDTKVRFTLLRPAAAGRRRCHGSPEGRGLTVEILSGDLAGRGAEGRQGQPASTDWRAGVSPFDKSAAIEPETAQGRKVLMVGDGLNDAAALAQAHAAMAPGIGARRQPERRRPGVLGRSLIALFRSHARRPRARDAGRWRTSASPRSTTSSPRRPPCWVSSTRLIAAVAMSSSSLVVTLNALRMNLTGGRR